MLKETTKDPKEYTASEARANFADIVDQAHYGDTIVVRKHKKRVAIVSVDMLEHLSVIEAELDAIKAEKALEEFQSKGGISMQKLKLDLEMD